MLGERHAFEEWQETASTFLINLAAAPAEESDRFAIMSRPKIVVSEKWSRRLEKYKGLNYQPFEKVVRVRGIEPLRRCRLTIPIRETTNI